MKSLARVDHAFGEHVIFNGTSLELPDNGVVALRGPNGSGKTTLLKLLGGVIATSCQEIQGWRKDYTAVYLDTDYLTLDYLTAGELLDMVRPLTGDAPGERGHQLLTEQMLATKVSDLSLGQRQRLALTVALALRQVDVLLLDEPLNGLDHEASGTARTIIREAGQSRLVIVATHEDEHWTDYDLLIRGDQAVELNRTGARQ
ncbi:ATP-binding cassette domain-containing protein [Paenarthrobacter sp. NPDC089322]|uniref:ABC transporter ATP-binding protein n=1 Tax=Paenarthrobacter sp. NPDC089322 TaxID=3155065 RepID=UPI00343904CE